MLGGGSSRGRRVVEFDVPGQKCQTKGGGIFGNGGMIKHIRGPMGIYTYNDIVSHT